jgi:hypothetical protein
VKRRTDEADGADELLRRLLGDLPARRAPATLESRVLQELQRRALPWRARGFRCWPLPARCAFVALCGALVGITFPAAEWMLAAARALPFAHPPMAVLAAAGELPALLTRMVPPPWLYGVMFTGGLLYAALFGLGAIAYRTLYRLPATWGDCP